MEYNFVEMITKSVYNKPFCLSVGRASRTEDYHQGVIILFYGGGELDNFFFNVTKYCSNFTISPDPFLASEVVKSFMYKKRS